MSSAFDQAVERQVRKLDTSTLAELERAIADKRRRWVEQLGVRWLTPHPTPRAAYELFFARYLEVDLAEVPVVSQSPDRIVWRSVNPCPTLEACARLGLDTRLVCRAVYDSSTQAFMSAIDPSLRFGRSYDMIRPHAPYCEEWIIRRSDEQPSRS